MRGVLSANAFDDRPNAMPLAPVPPPRRGSNAGPPHAHEAMAETLSAAVVPLAPEATVEMEEEAATTVAVGTAIAAVVVAAAETASVAAETVSVAAETAAVGAAIAGSA